LIRAEKRAKLHWASSVSLFSFFREHEVALVTTIREEAKRSINEVFLQRIQTIANGNVAKYVGRVHAEHAFPNKLQHMQISVQASHPKH